LAGAFMALLEAALEATDLRWAAVTAGILEAALAILAAAFGTGASADLDLASMDTRAGSTPITAMAPVWCPLLTATPGLATDIQHRNLLSALHARWVRRLDRPLGRQTRSLPYATCDKHTATYGDVTRHLACLRWRLSRVELVGMPFLRRSTPRSADHQGGHAS
jgi:hypothetical protein